MAQALNITIRINELGLDVIDKVIDKIKNLNLVIQKTNFQPFAAVAENIEKISSSIKNIDGVTENVVQSVKKQAVDSVGEVQTSIDQTIQRLYARSAVAFLGATALGSQTVQKFGALIFSETTTASGKFSALGLLMKNVFLDAGRQIQGSFFTNFVTGFKEVAFFSEAIRASFSDFIGTFLGGVTKILGNTALLGGFFFSFKLFSRETKELFGRLTGLGTKVTPLERATNVITAIDFSFRSINLTAGQLIKTIGLGVATFIGPFSGIVAGIPFINQTVTSLANAGTNIRLRVLNFLGDARARFQIAFTSVRDIFSSLLPLVQQFLKNFQSAVPGIAGVAKNFGLLQANAIDADKQLKRFGDNPAFKALSLTKIPITAQLQLFFNEARTFLTELLQKATVVSLILAKSLGLSKSEIAQINKDADLGLEKVNSGLQSVNKKFLDFAQRGFWSRFFDLSRSRIFTTIASTFGIVGKLLVGTVFGSLKLGLGALALPIKAISAVSKAILPKDSKLSNEELKLQILKEEEAKRKDILFLSKVEGGLAKAVVEQTHILNSLLAGTNKSIQKSIDFSKIEVTVIQSITDQANKLNASIQNVSKSIETVVKNTEKIAENLSKSAKEAQRVSLPEIKPPVRTPVLPSGKEINSSPKLSSLSFSSASDQKKETEAIKEKSKSVELLAQKVSFSAEKIATAVKKTSDVLSSAKDKVSDFSGSIKSRFSDFFKSTKVDLTPEPLIQKENLKEKLRRQIEQATPIFQEQQARLSELFYKQKKETIASIGGNRFNFEDMFLALLKEGKSRKKIDSIMIGSGFLGQYKETFDQIQKDFFAKISSKAQSQSSILSLSGVGKSRDNVLGKVFSLDSIKEIKPLTVEIAGFRKEIADAVKNILNFDKASLSLDKTFKGMRTPVTKFGNLVEMFVGGQNVKTDTFQKAFDQINRSFFSFKEKFKTGSDSDIGKIMEGLHKKFAPDKKVIGVAFKALEVEIDRLSKDGVIKGKSFGKKLTDLIAQGIRGNTEVVGATQKLAELIAAFFPQSPAKMGPLRNLTKMGSEIVKQLGGGMRSAMGIADKDTSAIAERIAGFFPQSPALFGPLTFLPKMGFKIVSQLMDGITSGFSLITGTVDRLASLIAKPLENIKVAAGIELQSQRTGVSVETITGLRGAVEELGGSGSDLDFVFARMQETLSKTFSSEERLKIAGLGIDLDAIKQSGDPVLSLFFAASNAVKDFGVGTERTRQVLDLLGTTTNSTLVNVLASGSEKLAESIQRTAEFGGVLDKNFTKNALAINKVFNQLGAFKNFLLNDFLAQILPAVQEKTEALLEFLRANSLQIRTFFSVAGQLLVNTASLVGKFAALLVRDPAKAFNALLGITGSIFKLMFRTISAVFSNIQTSLAQLLGAIFDFVYRFFDEAIPPLKEKISLYSELLMANVRKVVIESIPSIWGIIGSFIKKVVDIAIWLVQKITTVIFNLPSSIFLLGTRITELVRKLAIKIIAALAETIKGTFLEDFLKFMGIDATLIAENSDLAIAEIDKMTKEAEDIVLGSGNKVRKELDRLTSVDAAKVDISDIEGKILSSKGITKIFSEAAEKASAEFTKIKSAADSLGDNLAKPELFAEMKNNLQQTLDEMKQSLSDAGLAEEFQKILDTLSPQNFASTMTVLQQRVEQTKKKMEEPAKAAEQNNPWYVLDQGQKQFLDHTQQGFSTVGTMFTDLYELTGKKRKEFLIFSKAAAIAEATIGIAQAIITALGAPFPFNLALPGITAAAGAIQIAKIASTGLPGYVEGGPVFGREGIDKIPAMLTNREFVIPVPAVDYYGIGFFEALRRKMIPKQVVRDIAPNIPKASFTPSLPAFNQGGLVNSGVQQATSSVGGTAITIVNVADPNAAEKFLVSKRGEKLVINMMGNNKNEIKRILAD